MKRLQEKSTTHSLARDQEHIIGFSSKHCSVTVLHQRLLGIDPEV